jgi:hypothetical protein
MSDDKKTLKGDEASADNPSEKPYFGSLKPLTAMQIISLIVPDGKASAAACY